MMGMLNILTCVKIVIHTGCSLPAIDKPVCITTM